MRNRSLKIGFQEKRKKQKRKIGINLRLNMLFKIRLDENEINKLEFTIYTLVIFFFIY
jgi:hypothetical protein